MSYFPDSVSNLVELARYRTGTKPGFEAYTWLSEERSTASLSYQELDRRARRIAVLLESAGLAKSPVLLAYPPSLDFIVAFFGCLYAGAIAVPIYPPDTSRGWARLTTIAGDCGARFGLTIGPLAKRFAQNDLAAVRWFSEDGIKDEAAEQWKERSIRAEALAFLQYTSGSTGDPKGVMVSHGNIMANERAIQKSFGQDESDIIVSWLPMGHDMGLIGGVLQPLHVGARCLLFSPIEFVREPIRWLRTISAHGATTSGGPDFSYRLCSRKIGPEQKAGLDLSCWRVAFNGAEPVRRDTLDEFSETFRDCGFRQSAFHPCYGLAEATLLVSCDGRGRARTDSANQFVGCGPVIEQHSLRIVDPKTGLECSDGATGEILVAGPSIAGGYWGRPAESDATFRAQVPGDDSGYFLRTGDLGFLQHGDLMITGRLKDLIILRGQNYYPQDIEISAERSCRDLQPGACVAFAIGDGDDQQVVVVQEVSAKSSSYDPAMLAICRAVSIECGIHLDAVVLVPRNAVPKTSSGKVRRQGCRQLFESGEIKIIAQWRSQPAAAADDGSAQRPTDFGNVESVCAWLINQLTVLTGVDARYIDPNADIVAYGIDSLTAVELTNQCEALGVELDFTVLFSGMTIRNLAELIANSPKEGRGRPEAGKDDVEFPLSRGQYPLWLNQQLAPAASVYNLAFAARTRSQMSASAVHIACAAVVARHSILRAIFPVVDGQPRHHIIERPADFFIHVDARGWEPGEAERQAAIAAYQPFDLATGPLLRVIFYECGSGSSLILVVVHHIISDFSSLALLVREIFMQCGAAAERPKASPAPFSEYIRREGRLLDSDTENRLWEFWRAELAPPPPPLELPVAYPATTSPARESGWESTRISPSTVIALRRLSTQRNTTLQTTLLSTFQVLLHRYSGQSDFAVAVPVSLRDGVECRHTQGYFINPVILRASFDGDPVFPEFLDKTRQRMLRALSHRHFPFGTLVSRLQPVRTPGRPPIAQAIFIFLSQQGPVSDGVLFGLGLPGAKLTVGDFEFESLGLRPVSTEFDLTLMIGDGADGLHAALGYSRNLFSQEMAAAMLRSWQLLLDGIVANPSSRVSSLPVLSPEEIQLALVQFNETALPFDENSCIHQAFERKAMEVPDRTAVSSEGVSLTYADLNDRANRLASYLRAAGVRPDDVIGICLRRSEDLLVGLLGVLKSGGAYLPLDADYPAERIAFMLADSRAQIVIVHEALTDALQGYQGTVVCIDRDWTQVSQYPARAPIAPLQPANLAYVIYTSGSTGTPKGVMITHRSVMNLFAGMDRIIDSEKCDAWLAVTSICFDISVLELLWTVTRGVRVLVGSGLDAITAVNPRNIGFSLFYFASDAAAVPEARYQLLLEGVRFADENGFEAVWTPERHFHAFGGSYPNSSLMGAALATITKRIHLRAGSVVLPLHHPIRVAEDWSVVDNLSKGRIGVSFASGWHAEDFVLAPASYGRRREIMFRDIETVRKLWRGEKVQFQSGTGNEVAVQIHPAPIQPELPVWVTAAGTEETFRMAGEIGANVLTHLLGQSVAEVAHNVSVYRAAWRSAGHPGEGKVTLMLHTFVGHNTDSVRETVREPMIAYLKDSVSLIKNFVRSIGEAMPEDLDSPNMKTLLDVAFDRYFESSGLFGTPERCLKMVEQLKGAQIDEIACLIDFGVETSSVLESLRLLAEVKRLAKTRLAGFEGRPSHLQCTPTLARMLLDREDVLNTLSCMLVGGEVFPAADAERLTKRVPGSVHNMYGPTETCVWSTSDLLNPEAVQVTLGRPIANTRVYVTDGYGGLVPPGVAGEICIGGEGVARGYWRRPELTATRFIPDPFSAVIGARMYRTGDRGTLSREGRLQFLGRLDHQVKLRGYRIELGEIEEAVSHHPAVREAAAMVQSARELNSKLLCYVVAQNAHRPSVEELRGFLATKLPEHMLPADFIWLEQMPRTPNGKLDRMLLASAGGTQACMDQLPKPPQDAVEEVLVEMWSELLGADFIGVESNFFDLGGHSLLAVRFVGMVREIFQVSVDLGVFFKNPTIAALAKTIKMIAGDRAERCAELLRTVEHLPEEQVEVMFGTQDQHTIQ